MNGDPETLFRDRDGDRLQVTPTHGGFYLRTPGSDLVFATSEDLRTIAARLTTLAGSQEPT